MHCWWEDKNAIHYRKWYKRFFLKKIKNRITWVYIKKLECRALYRFVYIHIYRSIIYNNQRWKQPKSQSMDE